jgi:hypothetical protein
MPSQLATPSRQAVQGDTVPAEKPSPWIARPPSNFARLGTAPHSTGAAASVSNT